MAVSAGVLAHGGGLAADMGRMTMRSHHDTHHLEYRERIQTPGIRNAVAALVANALILEVAAVSQLRSDSSALGQVALFAVPLVGLYLVTALLLLRSSSGAAQWAWWTTLVGTVGLLALEIFAWTLPAVSGSATATGMLMLGPSLTVWLAAALLDQDVRPSWPWRGES